MVIKMKTTNHLFLDIHVIQTLPPSNINRDDTGSPKTAHYGGVMRSRVSSQSWKKAMRDYFSKYGQKSNVGVRTLEIIKYVAEIIRELDETISEEVSIQLADKVFNRAGVKTKDYRAKALFFLGDNQARRLAKEALANNDDKKELQYILRDNPAIDIALFGRMVADDPSLNEDASAQVAHAISTHAVQMEFDFYTAVDDLSPEDNAGAGMLGTIEFNSSTLYRYANVAVHELFRQLQNKEATLNTVKLFIESFANSLPTGKVNTFANQTFPQAVVVTLREDRPINLVSAFEQPIKSSEGYIDKSIEKLFAEFKRAEKFVQEPLATFYVVNSNSNRLENVGVEKSSLKELLDDISQEVLKLTN